MKIVIISEKLEKRKIKCVLSFYKICKKNLQETVFIRKVNVNHNLIYMIIVPIDRLDHHPLIRNVTKQIIYTLLSRNKNSIVLFNILLYS